MQTVTALDAQIGSDGTLGDGDSNANTIGYNRAMGVPKTGFPCRLSAPSADHVTAAEPGSNSSGDGSCLLSLSAAGCLQRCAQAAAAAAAAASVVTSSNACDQPLPADSHTLPTSTWIARVDSAAPLDQPTLAAAESRHCNARRRLRSPAKREAEEGAGSGPLPLADSPDAAEGEEPLLCGVVWSSHCGGPECRDGGVDMSEAEALPVCCSAAGSKSGDSDAVASIISGSCCGDQQSSGHDSSSVELARGWRRSRARGRVSYFSPSGNRLSSMDDVRSYLLRDDTCKCGLQCPLVPSKHFCFSLTCSGCSKQAKRVGKVSRYSATTADAVTSGAGSPAFPNARSSCCMHASLLAAAVQTCSPPADGTGKRCADPTKTSKTKNVAKKDTASSDGNVHLDAVSRYGSTPVSQLLALRNAQSSLHPLSATNKGVTTSSPPALTEHTKSTNGPALQGSSDSGEIPSGAISACPAFPIGHRLHEDGTAVGAASAGVPGKATALAGDGLHVSVECTLVSDGSSTITHSSDGTNGNRLELLTKLPQQKQQPISLPPASSITVQTKRRKSAAAGMSATAAAADMCTVAAAPVLLPASSSSHSGSPVAALSSPSSSSSAVTRMGCVESRHQTSKSTAVGGPAVRAELHCLLNPATFGPPTAAAASTNREMGTHVPLPRAEDAFWSDGEHCQAATASAAAQACRVPVQEESDAGLRVVLAQQQRQQFTTARPPSSDRAPWPWAHQQQPSAGFSPTYAPSNSSLAVVDATWPQGDALPAASVPGCAAPIGHLPLPLQMQALRCSSLAVSGNGYADQPPPPYPGSDGAAPYPGSAGATHSSRSFQAPPELSPGVMPGTRWHAEQTTDFAYRQSLQHTADGGGWACVQQQQQLDAAAGSQSMSSLSQSQTASAAAHAAPPCSSEASSIGFGPLARQDDGTLASRQLLPAASSLLPPQQWAPSAPSYARTLPPGYANAFQPIYANVFQPGYAQLPPQLQQQQQHQATRPPYPATRMVLPSYDYPAYMMQQMPTYAHQPGLPAYYGQPWTAMAGAYPWQFLSSMNAPRPVSHAAGGLAHVSPAVYNGAAWPRFECAPVVADGVTARQSTAKQPARRTAAKSKRAKVAREDISEEVVAKENIAEEVGCRDVKDSSPGDSSTYPVTGAIAETPSPVMQPLPTSLPAATAAL